MALTPEQVALWRRNAVMAGGRTSSIAIKIMLARIIALADEVLVNREAQPAPEVPAEIKTTIELLLSAEMAKYQNSMSVPDDLVALAASVAGLTK